MKYLLVLLFLTGCQMNPENLTIGAKVIVKSGFYKSCVGYVTGISNYSDFYAEFTLHNVVCPKVSINFIRESAQNLKKL